MDNPEPGPSNGLGNGGGSKRSVDNGDTGARNGTSEAAVETSVPKRVRFNRTATTAETPVTAPTSSADSSHLSNDSGIIEETHSEEPSISTDSRDRSNVTVIAAETHSETPTTSADSSYVSNDSGIIEETNSEEPTTSADSRDVSNASGISTQALDIFPERAERYDASGLKNSLHGNIYQVKLGLLFLKRAWRINYAAFLIATEMDAAEKFDDLVFQYKNNDQIFCRFLQAKHSQNQSKKITANDLVTSTETNYSLQKYFASYRKIKSNPKFNGGNREIKDFIICCNIGFDNENLNRAAIKLQQITDIDDLLSFVGVSSQAARYRLVFDNTHEIFQRLKQTSDFHKLKNAILDSIKTKSFSLNTAIFKEYHAALGKEVLSISREGNSYFAEFKENFFSLQTGNGISQQAEKLRDILKLSPGFDEQVWQSLEFKVSAEFGNNNEKPDLPNDDVITNEEIVEFFSKLVVAVNQPDEMELYELIKKELGEEFNLIDSDLIADNFLIKVLDWMKAKDGTYLTETGIMEFFRDAKEKIAKLIVCGPTSEYCIKIREHGIIFHSISEELQSFLSPGDTCQILNFVTDVKSGTLLNSIKVDQTLQSIDAYKQADSYIFVHIKTLTRLSERVIQAFNSSVSNNLLVVVCLSTNGENVQSTFTELARVLASNGSKKIILVSHSEDPFPAMFQSDNSNNYRRLNSTVNYVDLTEDSQKQLLCKEILFQGECGNLRDIIGTNSAAGAAGVFADAEIFSCFISNDNIRIGNLPPRLVDSEAAFCKPDATVDLNVLSDVLSNESDNSLLFMISGFESTNLLVAQHQLIHRLKIEGDREVRTKIANQTYIFRGSFEDKRIVLVANENPSDNSNTFKNLCRQFPSKSVQWLKIPKGKRGIFQWQQLYDAEFYTKRILMLPTISMTKKIKEELLNVSSDIFIFENIHHKSELFHLLDISEDSKSLILENEDIMLSNSQAANSFKNSERKNKVAWHIFKVEDLKIVWRESSSGSLSTITKYIDNISENRLHENNFVQAVDRKAIIIVDEPGMGKSTSLLSFCRHFKTKYWTMLFNLKSCQNVIRNLFEFENFSHFTVDTLVDFLASVESIGLSNGLSKNVLKFILQNETPKPLLLLFDGFDELEIANKPQITELLQFLKDETKAIVWVTSREHDKEYLQNSLSTFAVKFEEFSRISDVENNDRENFLVHFWKMRLALSMTLHNLVNLRTYAKSVVNKASNVLGDELSRFIGIPLQLRLLAEYFFERIQNFQPEICIENFDVLDLYQHFIDKRYKIYFAEKSGIQASLNPTTQNWFKEPLNKRHKKLAIQELIPNELTDVFQSWQCKETDSEMNELYRVGLIHKIKFEFIHRTFAEYFVADAFLKELGKKQRNPTKYNLIRDYLQTHIFKWRNMVIYDFLKNGTMKQSEALRNEFESINSCDLMKGEQGTNQLDYITPVATKEKSLRELTEEVKKLFSPDPDLYNPPFYYYDHRYTYRITNLYQRFFKESNVTELKSTLEFLTRMNGKSSLVKANKLISKDINNAVKYYLTEAKTHNKLDVAFITNILERLIGRSAESFSNLKCEDFMGRELLYLFLKLSGKNISQEIKTDTNTLFIYNATRCRDDKSRIRWLEVDGAEIVRNMMLLTSEMSRMFISILRAEEINGFHTNYARNIFHGLILPILNAMKYNDELSEINKIEFLYMFQAFAKFSSNNNIKLFLNSVQLKTVLLWVENALEGRENFCQNLLLCLQLLIQLRHWNLKIIGKGGNILVQDPFGEFEFQLTVTHEKEIIDVLRWRKENTTNDLLQKCNEVAAQIIAG